jgi:hypothetical protein
MAIWEEPTLLLQIQKGLSSFSGTHYMQRQSDNCSNRLAKRTARVKKNEMPAIKKAIMPPYLVPSHKRNKEFSHFWVIQALS